MTVDVVQLTEDLVARLRKVEPGDAARCLADYLASLEEGGCRDLRHLRQALERMSLGLERRGRAGAHLPSAPVARALDFLRQHYTERVTWGEVAAAVGRNRAYLARRFRRETGATLCRQLAVLRIHRARQLIARGEKIEFVMLSVGYHSKRTFYSHFRSTFGVTPGAFRIPAMRPVPPRPPAER